MSRLLEALGRLLPVGQASRDGRIDVVGHLDRVENGHVYGWALKPANPADPVRLRVLVDGDLVGEGIADSHRLDLMERSLGDGRCAFVIALPADRCDGREHAVEVVVASSGRRLTARAPRFHLDPPGHLRRRLFDVLFDAASYSREAEAKGLGPVVDAFDHFHRVGMRYGLNPHLLFDGERYAILQKLPSAKDSFAHFEAVGQHVNASVHALFDVAPALTGTGAPAHPVIDYLERRTPQQTGPSPFFSDADYAERNPGVVEAGFLPLVHYLGYGWREGRRPHQDFDPKIYALLAGLGPEVEPYGFFVDWLKRRRPRPKTAEPRLSIVILNLDKALLTLQCLFFLERHTDLRSVEIIIVDNGSRDEDFAMLCRFAAEAEIVRLGDNLDFGEGNNIGAERARGEFVAFLNNDTFVKEGWLPPLLVALDAEASVGAVGAKLLFPDGRLQEAGAMISACGTAVQRGKHLDPAMPLFNRTEAVDYCSAALLLVRTAAFRSVFGFDLCWDPAYYEDSDLCLKLRSIGLRTVYVHSSEAVHLEHATASDAKVAAGFRHLVASNRLKFVARWMQNPAPVFLKDPAVVAELAPRSATSGSLALYTPYPLTPGGGERYLLTIAATFGRERRCVLFTPERTSRIRLLTLARELELDLDHVAVAPFDSAGEHERFDLFV